MSAYLFSSESVSEGHPDKIADQISDAILDAILIQDPISRVACETLVKTGMVLVAGEITTSAWVDIEAIARQVIKNIGYNHSDMGFDWESCAILSAIGKQSLDIARGVNAAEGKVAGAGDQGLVFGYACNETDVGMPAPILYAHRLMQRQSKMRKEGILPWLRPDAKSQITMRYENGVPVGIDAVVLSTQHDPDVSQSLLIEAVMETIIKPVLPAHWLSQDTRYFINATGRFVIGGPLGDCGLTGRKVIVDSYGGVSRHGGGCFSGKDPSKVDRSGAYIARYVAKNIVTAGLAEKCEIQIAYVIGVSDPVSVYVNSFNTGKISDRKIEQYIKEIFDLSPEGIIESLDLLKPIYLPTAAYGHFGREEEGFSWEKTDKIKELQERSGIFV